MKTKLYFTMAWRLTLDVFSRGTAFVINILIARSLSVGDFGKFGYALSITQIFYIFTDLGMHLQLMKELGESRSRDQTYWKYFYGLKLFLMALCACVTAILAVYLWHWENPLLLMMLLLWMFSNSMLDFNQTVCNGLGRLELAQKIMVTQRLLVIAGVAVALLFFRSLTGVVSGLAIGAVLGSIFSNNFFFHETKTKFSLKMEWGEWKKILWRSLPNGVGSTFGSWYLRIGFVLLAWNATSTVLGEYNAAFRVFEISYIVPSAIMAIGVPHLAESFGLGRAVFHSEIKRVSAVIVSLALGWVLVVHFGSPLIVRALFGTAYAGAVPVLKCFGLAGGVVFINHLITYLMVILNKQRRHAMHEIIVFLIGLTLALVLIPERGAMGAALALLGTECSLFAITMIYLLRAWRSIVPPNDCAKMAQL